MKKMVLLTILSVSYFIIHAQVIEKNKRILGGSLGFGFSHQASNALNSGASSTGNHFNVNLYPSFGKAIKNNLVFGYHLNLGYSHAKSDEEANLNLVSKSNGYTTGAGVFLEKFFPTGKSLSFSGYLPLNISYGANENKQWNNSAIARTYTSNNFTAGISLSPSLNYSLNKKFMLQFSLNDFVSFSYIRGSSETKIPNTATEKQTNSSFGFASSVNSGKRLADIYFGFRYIFQ